MLGSAIAQVVPRELLPNWHLIGHSLGGQMAGQEARSIFTATGVKVGRFVLHTTVLHTKNIRKKFHPFMNIEFLR